MVSTRGRRRLGWALVGASLALHAFTVLCHTRQPDVFAAFLIVPLWLWGLLGLALAATAFIFLRANLSLILSALWSLTILLGADEARNLPNLVRQRPSPGPASPHHGRPVLRVITLNCGAFRFGDPAPDLAAWHPDILLVQETEPHQVRHLADEVFGGRGDYRAHGKQGILTRWRITREVRVPPVINDSPRLAGNQQATITLPDGTAIEVVNVDLRSAPPDLRLWRATTWREHRDNRRVRRKELAVATTVLAQTCPSDSRPILFGGDFNSPSGDAVYELLEPDFKDCFPRVGTGWGNTFQRRLPFLRIDRVYANRHLAPVRATAWSTASSDHRMLITDFLLKFH